MFGAITLYPIKASVAVLPSSMVLPYSQLRRKAHWQPDSTDYIPSGRHALQAEAPRLLP